MMRTDQDLLAERRATVLEQTRERDPVARQMLQFSIEQIDRELHERRQAIPVIHAAGVLQPPIPVIPINPPPTRNAIDDAFAATRETIADLVAERDARAAQAALDDMFAQERELDLVSVGGIWSPAHHVRAA